MLGEFGGGAGAGAEPESRFALELLEERRGELHLVAEPVGDRASGEGFRFDGLRIAREAVVKVGGVRELFLKRFLRVKPPEPAVIDKHDAADGAFLAGAETAGEAEITAQGGVGGKIGRRFTKDAGGVVEDRGFEHRSREKKHPCGAKGNHEWTRMNTKCGRHFGFRCGGSAVRAPRFRRRGSALRGVLRGVELRDRAVDFDAGLLERVAERVEEDVGEGGDLEGELEARASGRVGDGVG